jgi:glycosyltransferase involved in cell wall biosynthesis
MKQIADLGSSTSNAEDAPALFLLNALGIGGSERKTVNVINALHARGLNVHLAYLDPRTPLLKKIDEGIPVTFLARKGKFSISAAKTLRGYILRKRVSRVVCISLYPYLYAKAAIALLPVRSRPTITLMVNATEHETRKARLQMALYTPMMHRADKIVFGCEAQRDIWIRRYKFDADKCEIIYNGIDTDRFQPRIVSRIVSGFVRNKGDIVIGAVGTLWPNKNHIELVSLIAHLKNHSPGVRLLLAGEGVERDHLEQAAADWGVADRVTLLGEVEDIRPVIDLMDIFVLPSISETFSNAALEAMAMEKAVILSNTGGIPEMVKHSVDGFLYQRGDLPALAALIEELAAAPERREEIGRRARETVLQRFTFDRMVDEYQRLLV